MKTVAKKKPINWRNRYDALLKVLFNLRNDPRAGYVDLRLRSKHAEDLHKILEREKRYEWRKVGEALHLFPLHDRSAGSVAFIVKVRSGKYEYTINLRGIRNLTDYTNTEPKAKQAVEKHFELLRSESE